MGKKLPRSVQEIADVIGVDDALYLVGKLPRAYCIGHPSGECILYVPKSLKVEHPLVSMLGWKSASRLVKAFGGEILKPAHCAGLYRDFRDRSIRRLLIEGHQPATLAEWFEVCERHVRNIAREIPREVEGNRVLETV